MKLILILIIISLTSCSNLDEQKNKIVIVTVGTVFPNGDVKLGLQILPPEIRKLPTVIDESFFKESKPKASSSNFLLHINSTSMRRYTSNGIVEIKKNSNAWVQIVKLIEKAKSQQQPYWIYQYFLHCNREGAIKDINEKINVVSPENAKKTLESAIKMLESY